MNEISCPKCNREWPEGCEQAICIYWYKECIVCKFSPLGSGSNNGSVKEFQRIANEREIKLAAEDVK